METATVKIGAATKTKRRTLAVIALLSLLVLLLGIFALVGPQRDFIEYWSASHLLSLRQDPYSILGTLHLQRQLGWAEANPLMFVSPPWALPLVTPLALTKSYGLGWLLWTLMLLAAVALASRLLMDIYFDGVRIPEISDTTFCRALFAFTFYPVLLCLKFSQTAPLILLGVAGFLYFERRGRPLVAGLFLALTLIKPQLLLLLWIALVFRSLQQRRWATLASAAVAIAVFSGIAVLLDPHVFGEYLQLTRTPYLAINPSGITAILRRALNHGDVSNTYWMQFVPPLGGVAWFTFYWRKHRAQWNWTERMPALVTVSVLTTAYGWIFDQTVLALVVIAIAAQSAKTSGGISRNLVWMYSALNGGLMLLMAVPPLTFIPAPIFLAYLLARREQPLAYARVVPT